MSRLADHHEHQLTPRLGPLVERMVGYRIDGYPAGVHVGMPSGTVTLVIAFDDDLALSDGHRAEPSRFGSVIAGLATGPTRIHHNGTQHGIQLALPPGAVRALFAVPAAELAEGSFELGDVMGVEATSLRDRLHEIPTWQGRFEMVEQVLLARLHEPPPVAPELAEAWRLIAVSRGAAPIREVARVVGWSTRQLQQQFRAELGVSPKAVARVRRFERSVPLVSSARIPLTDVALSCGWSDHAHMNRDWRALAGSSPSRWRTDDMLANA